MEFKTLNENICLNQIVGQKEEKFTIEGEEIVPDIKPDILNIISSNGNICIYKKEIQNGKIKIEGSVYVYTLYLADDENSSLRCINSGLDFNKTIEIENVNDKMQIDDKCEIISIESKILNERKISISANIKIDIDVHSNEKVDIIKEIDNSREIQKLNKDYSIDSIIGLGNTKAYAKDTIRIKQEDNLSEIAKVKLNLINKETKVSYNKVLAKADAEVKIMYITEERKC